VASCRQRHPKWKAPGLDNDSAYRTDSLGTEMSMRDMKLSLDEDNITRTQSGNWRIKSPGDIEKLMRQGSGTPSDRPGKKFPSNNAGLHQLPEDGDAALVLEPRSTEELGMRLRGRKNLIVVAVDDYEASGAARDTLVKVLSAGVKAAKKEKTGFAVATALTGPELVALLDRAGVGLKDLDVVIAGSGSELYYAGPLQEGEKADKLTDKAGTKLHPDLDYNAHVEYRWGNDGLRKAMVNIVAAGSEKGAENGKVKPGLSLVEDRERMGHHRLAYKVIDLQQVRPTSVFRWRPNVRISGSIIQNLWCKSKFVTRGEPGGGFRYSSVLGLDSTMRRLIVLGAVVLELSFWLRNNFFPKELLITAAASADILTIPRGTNSVVNAEIECLFKKFATWKNEYVSTIKIN
jgi:sucrose-phosphate synthase